MINVIDSIPSNLKYQPLWKSVKDELPGHRVGLLFIAIKWKMAHENVWRYISHEAGFDFKRGKFVMWGDSEETTQVIEDIEYWAEFPYIIPPQVMKG